MTDSATAAGIGSVPTPLSQTDADYFVYQPWFAGFTFGSSASFTNSPSQDHAWVVDSKAMRKVGLDDDVATVVEAGVGTFGVNVSVEGRFLVQLH